MSFILCGHAQPADLCGECAAIRQVRQQYGRHRLSPAPDGGCRSCPLSGYDPIHDGWATEGVVAAARVVRALRRGAGGINPDEAYAALDSAVDDLDSQC